MSDRIFGINLFVEENVGRASICAESSIDRKIKILNPTILSKDLVEMVLIDILRQALDNDLCAANGRAEAPVSAIAASAPTATVASIAPITAWWRRARS